MGKQLEITFLPGNELVPSMTKFTVSELSISHCEILSRMLDLYTESEKNVRQIKLLFAVKNRFLLVHNVIKGYYNVDDDLISDKSSRAVVLNV